MLTPAQTKYFHNSVSLLAWESNKKPSNKWLKYNDVVDPPQAPGEAPRPVFVCHECLNVKYSPDKMWYVACLVRGMSFDEAIGQLKFVPKKDVKDVREIIEEAKQLGLKERNVEFGTILWGAESFVGQGHVVKDIRRHARGRFGIVEYKYCHYFVKLEENKPLKNYYLSTPKQPHEQLEHWFTEKEKS